MDLYAKLNQRMAEKLQVPSKEQCLPGRAEPIETSQIHYVSGAPIKPPFAEDLAQIVLALGCFWGAERKFWQLEGVYSTAVGYAGGYTPNPSYEEVCSGKTAHTEVVLVVFDPAIVSLEKILKCFWQSHDPTQGMRQGNDLGTQYRSAIYYFNDRQATSVTWSKERYQKALTAAGLGEITTEIRPLQTFFYAEAYHQQYLAKNPNGYCGLGGTGVQCTDAEP